MNTRADERVESGIMREPGVSFWAGMWRRFERGAVLLAFIWSAAFPANGAKEAPVIRTNWMFLDSFTDFSKDEILVGWAHDVFVGKVTAKMGYVTENRLMPYTRFAVQVVHNVKGTLSGQVLIDQVGGLKGTEYFQMRTDTPEGYPELTVGASYTFATRSGAADNPVLRLIGHANSHSLISTNAAATLAEVKAHARFSERVQKLTEAYKNEIVPPAFARDARNLYRDKARPEGQPPEQKAKDTDAQVK